MSSNRSKPFSGKQKKEQLQLKKQIKNLKSKNESKDEYWVSNDASNEVKTEKKSGRIKYYALRYSNRVCHFLV